MRRANQIPFLLVELGGITLTISSFLAGGWGTLIGRGRDSRQPHDESFSRLESSVILQLNQHFPGEAAWRQSGIKADLAAGPCPVCNAVPLQVFQRRWGPSWHLGLPPCLSLVEFSVEEGGGSSGGGGTGGAGPVVSTLANPPHQMFPLIPTYHHL